MRIVITLSSCCAYSQLQSPVSSVQPWPVGGYWQGDSNETRALIGCLNPAVLYRGVRAIPGVPVAWWFVTGLFVTLFAFHGVNTFL